MQDLTLRGVVNGLILLRTEVLLEPTVFGLTIRLKNEFALVPFVSVLSLLSCLILRIDWLLLLCMGDMGVCSEFLVDTVNDFVSLRSAVLEDVDSVFFLLLKNVVGVGDDSLGFSIP